MGWATNIGDWWARLISGPIRPRAFIAVFALFAANVAYWAISNWPWGGPSIVHWTPEPAIIVAEFSVAFGTIALAFAAYNQSLAAEKQIHATQAQNDLLRDQIWNQTQPNLSVRFRGFSLYTQMQANKRKDLSPGDAIELGEEDVAVYVSNAGPGVARSIQVEATGIERRVASDALGTTRIAPSIDVLGVGDSTQIKFTYPIHTGLFEGRTPAPPQTILFKVHSETATIKDDTEDEFDEMDPYGKPAVALGGLHMEYIPALDGKEQILAWKILTPRECSVLAGGWTDPKDPKIGRGPAGAGQLPVRRSQVVFSRELHST